MNPRNVIHSLLFIVFNAALLTSLSLAKLFGRNLEFHEALVFLVFGWIVCGVIAWIIARAGEGIPKIPA